MPTGIFHADIESQSTPFFADVELLRMVASGDFPVRRAPAFGDIEISPELEIEGLGYSVSEDCKTVTITIPEMPFPSGTISAQINEYGGAAVDATFQAVYVDGVGAQDIVITFQAQKDGVYSVRIIHSIVGLAATEEIFISCRGDKCFHKMNNRDGCEQEIEKAQALLAGAVAYFAGKQYAKSNKALDILSELCDECNCGCSC